jgi:uncharacterized membrane protein YgdD (TMEM256/DUF423 family)
MPIITISSIFALAATIAGALGAHALASQLAERGLAAAWNTAVAFHFLHCLALLAVGIWQRLEPAVRWRSAAVACWIAGILRFSGSIYGLALGGPRLLGPITPIGGVFLMAGWALLACSGWSRKA